MILEFFPVESFRTADDFAMYERKSEQDEFEPAAVSFDADNVEHMTWIYLKAKERAEQFNIKGLFLWRIMSSIDVSCCVDFVALTLPFRRSIFVAIFLFAC